MTIVRTEDNRNIEWRKNNVGANLLQKMGWKEGEGIGKRGTSSTTALRALKRQDGLGLGAKMANEGGQSESTNHFSTVLKNLQAHHAPATTSKKSKKKKKNESSSERTNNSSSLVLPQNKVVAGHAKKRRNAKFGEKSAEDLACIFGNSGAVFEPVPVMKESSEKSGSEEKEPTLSKKRSNSDDSEEKREKKRRKKEKKEKRKKKETSTR